MLACTIPLALDAMHMTRQADQRPDKVKSCSTVDVCQQLQSPVSTLPSVSAALIILQNEPKAAEPKQAMVLVPILQWWQDTSLPE